MPIHKYLRWLQRKPKPLKATTQPAKPVPQRDIYLDARLKDYYRQFPMTLIDIGARGGLPRHWKLAGKRLQVVGFEPDPRSFAKLTSQVGKRIILNTALYKEKATLRFHLTREEGDSSFLQPNHAFLKQFSRHERFDVVDVTEFEADTLDNQLRANGITCPDFIKADTQGTELFIFQGATDALSHSVFGVEVEVMLNPMYLEQPLLSDVDRCLRQFGFQLFDLRPVYWKRKVGEPLHQTKGQVIYADALYLKDLSAASQDVGKITTLEGRVAKVLKAVTICILYGYFDFALDLTNHHAVVLGKELTGIVTEAIHRQDQHARTPPSPRDMGLGGWMGSGTTLGDAG